MTTTPTETQIMLPNDPRKVGGGAGGALDSEDVTVDGLLIEEVPEFDDTSEEELEIDEVKVEEL